MKDWATCGLLLAAGWVTTGASQVGAGASAGATRTGLQLRSPAFGDGDRLPVLHTLPEAGGRNVSPALEWEGAPQGTRSFALAVIDIHPVARRFPHWLVHGIPPDVRGLPEAASGRQMPEGAVELRNGWGAVGWGGPRPPKGTGDHEYRFTLMALEVSSLAVPESADASSFLAAAHAHALATASISAYFGR